MRRLLLWIRIEQMRVSWLDREVRFGIWTRRKELDAKKRERLT